MNYSNTFLLIWNSLKGFSMGQKKINPFIGLFLSIIALYSCWWLYERFNTIPVYKNTVELYAYKSRSINPKVWLNQNLNFGIYKHTQTPHLCALWYEQEVPDNYYFDPIFSDSARNEIEFKLKMLDNQNLTPSVYLYSYYNFKNYLSLYDTIKCNSEKFKLDTPIFAIDFKYTQTYPSTQTIKWETPEGLIADSLYKYDRLFDTFFSKDEETGLNTVCGRIIKAESGTYLKLGKEYLLKNGLEYGNKLSNSFYSVFSLYDISQAYIIFDYKGNVNLDHVRFNFGSAVMVTGIDPSRAEIGMDYVIINDSTYIADNNNRNNEIRFHVAPKDTQNLQTMRLFLLTTFFVIIITYFINCLLKIFYRGRFRRFVPQKRDNGNSNIWSVYDCYFNQFSTFTCHGNYPSEEICLFYIGESYKRFKKHFQASKKIAKRHKKKKK